MGSLGTHYFYIIWLPLRERQYAVVLQWLGCGQGLTSLLILRQFYEIEHLLKCNMLDRTSNAMTMTSWPVTSCSVPHFDVNAIRHALVMTPTMLMNWRIEYHMPSTHADHTYVKYILSITLTLHYLNYLYSASGCTRGVQLKLWDPLRTRAIPERLWGVFTTRRYTNPRLPYLTWPNCSPCGDMEQSNLSLRHMCFHASISLQTTSCHIKHGQPRFLFHQESTKVLVSLFWSASE